MTHAPTIVRRLELRPETLERLEKLRQNTGMQSEAEVFRRALQIFEGLVEDQAAGKRFFVRDTQGNDTEVSF